MFRVFTRNWWRANPAWPDGREPASGAKHYIAHGVNEETARELCRDWNATHRPGILGRMAEFEEAT